MPRMDGVGFLKRRSRSFPMPSAPLLTAYADTNAAISAINQADVDYFFLKPWDPPDQHLYPPLDDLLGDWIANYHPAFEGIRVLGTRWSPKCYELRDFLARTMFLINGSTPNFRPAILRPNAFSTHWALRPRSFQSSCFPTEPSC